MEFMVFIFGAVNIVCIVFIIFSYYFHKKEINNLVLNNNLLSEENNHLKYQIDLLQKNNHILDKELSVAKENIINKDQKIIELQQDEQKSVSNAKAAIFEISQQLTQQLVSLSKQEHKEISDATMHNFSKNSQIFNEKFQEITNIVHHLKMQIDTSNNYLDNIKKALLSPSSVGGLGEITLENILKYSGLMDGIDYKMQYHFANNISQQSLRPDAIVFLPNKNLMVIDSKSSKFIMELADAENEQDIMNMLSKSMNNHLKMLSSKDYKDQINKHLESSYKPEYISMMMFIPSESALEKIQQFDKDFMLKAWDMNIYPIGPSGLVNILAHAKFIINDHKKHEHTEQILSHIDKLISSLHIVSEHARKIGVNIKGLVQNYDRFAGSFNSNLLPKVNKIKQMGITGSKNQQTISNIDRQQLISSNDLIEEKEID